MEQIIKPFDETLNKWLRDKYLQSLMTPVSYDGGITSRPRVRHYKLWEAIPPAEKPVNILEHVKNPGQDIWIWSDLHFGHKNIIRFSNRPFPDIPTMDEMLIKNFNDLVKPDDISIWVGDVSFRPYTETAKILYRLNGYKILIVGNHDFEKKKGVRKMPFDEVHIVYNLTVGETLVAFTHYPIDNLSDKWVNVHGHVHIGGHHADEVPSTSHINVNCEFHDYKPLNLDTLVKKVVELDTLYKEGKGKRAQIDYTEYD